MTVLVAYASKHGSTQERTLQGEAFRQSDALAFQQPMSGDVTNRADHVERLVEEDRT
jgi:hypothetical protein